MPFREDVQRPAVCEGLSTKPTPAYTTTVSATTTPMFMLAAVIEMAVCPTAIRAKPTGSSGYAPRASITRPPTIEVTALQAIAGKMSKPAISAVMPYAPSK